MILRFSAIFVEVKEKVFSCSNGNGVCTFRIHHFLQSKTMILRFFAIFVEVKEKVFLVQ